MNKIAYLGPAGTFTEQALRSQKDLSGHTFVPFQRFTDALAAASSGETDYAFVAIENAIEGTVNTTLDALIFDHELMIQREVDLEIKLDLVAPAGCDKGDIETVLSHPVAIAQCRKYLDATFPSAVVRPANSTSEAAQRCLEQTKTAALANTLAAVTHGLEILEPNVADYSNNKTRFVLVGTNTIPRSTGNDKTMVVLAQKEDRPGSLIAILQEFAAREINLSRLASRPIKTQSMGNYCFVVEFSGHIADEVVGNCLVSIKAKHADVKLLGSYANTDATETHKAQTDAAKVGAEDWLIQLRSLLAYAS